MEDYLEAIFVLSKTRGYARTSEIAKFLNVTPSSVVEMVGKIARLKLVVWKRYEGAYLTPEGRIHGETVHIRHETLRRFFELIGVSHDIADTEACIIEHELSPVTTNAIGNLVRFLETPAGANTCSALNMFLQFQDAGVPWSGYVEPSLPISSDDIQGSIQKTDQHFQFLSVLTRHDLLKSITALYGYLEILREHDSEIGKEEILSRIKSVASSMHRQISGSSELLIPGSTAHSWINIGTLIDTISKNLANDQVTIENYLHGIEIFADPLIEKVVYNLMENSIRHGGSVSRIRCESDMDGFDLVWSIQDDGSGIDPNKKHAIFRPHRGDNSGLGLAMVDQILSSCGMQIEEQGIPGEGALFVIRVPSPLFREHSSEKPVEQSIGIHMAAPVTSR
ncbi:MAG: ATP-binding protein [Methanospirillum sp.]|uniref:ATP-binding protein n=1 Tax=Methanospirillum sp. TaxID=45200 RepID=UPI00236A8E51|nr:ATP-binding protein [Methanospirillum sp.]MDD1729143.1 ATP-binding protein [Methanospirillum sp.]